MFDLKLLNLPELTTRYYYGMRLYETPNGDNYPSVTTVLGQTPLIDKSGLNEWIEKVGSIEAERTMKVAGARGNAIDSALTRFVMNDEDWDSGLMPINFDLSTSMAAELVEHVGVVYGTQLPLWSDVLHTGGRCDLACTWDGVNSILDFKNGRRLKDESWILSYFLQTTAYSYMLQERTGLVFPQIVILLGTDEGVQCFVKQRKAYRNRVKQIFITERI